MSNLLPYVWHVAHLELNFEQMIKEYYPIIYKICRVYSDGEDFDDLYQEVLVSLWKSHQSFQGKSKLSTWLYRVTLNTALTYQRKASKKKQQVSFDQNFDIAATDGEKQEQEAEIERLYKAIAQLKKDDRSIILLYLEEKKYEEIAEITGLTTTNVGVRVNRIKKRLFQLLNSGQHE